MKNYKIFIISCVSCFLIGRFAFQPKAKVQTKEVVKYVESKKEDKKTSVVTRTREEKKPDGTVITEITVSDNSSTVTESNQEYSSKKNKKSEYGSNVSIGLMIVKDIQNFKNTPDYAIFTRVPVVGAMSIISTLDTTKRIGIGVSLEF